MSAGEDEEQEIDPASFGRIERELVEVIGGEERVVAKIGGRRKTVEPREVQRFEQTIVRDLVGLAAISRNPRTSPTGNVRKGSAIPIKGRWIAGHLNSEGRDYINSIYKEWVFFIAFLNKFTQETKGVSEFNRSAGEYDSMYRYILMLEDLGLIERTELVSVSEDEYDFPVPPEFRIRRFVEPRAEYTDNQQAWDNPYRALYPDDYPDYTEPTEEDDEEEDEEPKEPEQPLPEIDEDEDDEDTDDGRQPTLEPIEDDEGPEKEDGLSISDFDEQEELIDIIRGFEDDIMIQAAQGNIGPDPAEPDQLSFGRISVIGAWAESRASINDDPLNLMVEVRTDKGVRQAGSITGQAKVGLEERLSARDPFPQWFPSYAVGTAFTDAYLDQMATRMKRSGQESDKYYDLIEQTFKTNRQF